MVHIGNQWDSVLAEDFATPSYQNLHNFLLQEYRTQTVYPDMYDIYNAFRFTDFSKVKVVIIGQDPYHGAGQAHGLAFSVQPGVDVPPSLRNIFQEMQTDLGIDNFGKGGTLTPWTAQGVFLLNAVLTVRAGCPGSHRGKGWETFTDAVITHLETQDRPIVYMLWGNYAKAKETFMHNPNHLILKSAHPSPLSASHGFFGCHHFSKANDFLEAHGETPVDWQL